MEQVVHIALLALLVATALLIVRMRSILAVVMLSGSMVGPPVFGLIVDTTGSYQMAWLAMALAGVMSVLFIAMIRERRP